MMDRIISDVQEFTAVYMDDVIFSNTWEDHIQHLEQVFERLKRSGLTVKEQKCQFARKECVYLGHKVGQERVTPEESKVEAVRNFRTLRTKKGVRAFLGLAGYYRRFTCFASIATPLSNLTRKTEPNVLRWKPDFDHEFLQTDASNEGIGAVLVQKDGQGEHPLAFYSRKLLDREKKYAAVEKECLALVAGIKHFRIYLEGTPFTIDRSSISRTSRTPIVI